MNPGRLDERLVVSEYLGSSPFPTKMTILNRYRRGYDGEAEVENSSVDQTLFAFFVFPVSR